MTDGIDFDPRRLFLAVYRDPLLHLARAHPPTFASRRRRSERYVNDVETAFQLVCECARVMSPGLLHRAILLQLPLGLLPTTSSSITREEETEGSLGICFACLTREADMWSPRCGHRWCETCSLTLRAPDRRLQALDHRCVFCPGPDATPAAEAAAAASVEWRRPRRGSRPLFDLVVVGSTAWSAAFAAALIPLEAILDQHGIAFSDMFGSPDGPGDDASALLRRGLFDRRWGPRKCADRLQRLNAARCQYPVSRAPRLSEMAVYLAQSMARSTAASALGTHPDGGGARGQDPTPWVLRGVGPLRKKGKVQVRVPVVGPNPARGRSPPSTRSGGEGNMQNAPPRPSLQIRSLASLPPPGGAALSAVSSTSPPSAVSFELNAGAWHLASRVGRHHHRHRAFVARPCCHGWTTQMTDVMLAACFDLDVTRVAAASPRRLLISVRVTFAPTLHVSHPPRLLRALCERGIRFEVGNRTVHVEPDDHREPGVVIPAVVVAVDSLDHPLTVNYVPASSAPIPIRPGFLPRHGINSQRLTHVGGDDCVRDAEKPLPSLPRGDRRRHGGDDSFGVPACPSP